MSVLLRLARLPVLTHALVLTQAFALILAGCATTRQTTPNDAPALAARVLAAHGQAPGAVADVLARLKPAGQDATVVQFHLWCAPDGRMRLTGSKLDVEFCSALVAADGTWTCWLPRAKRYAQGTLADADLPTLFAEVRVFADELTAGPLPPGGPFLPGAAPHTISCPAGAQLIAEATIAGDDTVAAKRLRDRGGRVVADLTYERYHDYDGLKRATKVRLSVPDDAGEYALHLRSFEDVPAISAERMRLDVPADAQRVDVRDLLDHLGD